MADKFKPVLSDKNTLLSVPLESIPLNVSLPYHLYIQVNKKFVLFRKRLDTLNSKRADLLTQKKVDTIYIFKSDWDNFISLLKEQLGEFDLTKDPEDAAKNIRSLLFAYGRLYESSRTISSDHLNEIISLSEKLALLINKNPHLCVQLLKRFNDTSTYLVNHQLNMAVYSAAIAKKNDFNVTKLSQIIFTSLLHNVGMGTISKEVRYKPGPLTESEWAQIKEHPTQSAEVLEELGLPQEIVLAALQHHERVDGSGYPEKTAGNKLTEFARILAMADVYDAMLSHRPWKTASSLSETTAELTVMQKEFDNESFNLI